MLEGETVNATIRELSEIYQIIPEVKLAKAAEIYCWFRFWITDLECFLNFYLSAFLILL